jgi:hypothetical protein
VCTDDLIRAGFLSPILDVTNRTTGPRTKEDGMMAATKDKKETARHVKTEIVLDEVPAEKPILLPPAPSNTRKASA